MFELPETLVNVSDRWDTKLRTVNCGAQDSSASYSVLSTQLKSRKKIYGLSTGPPRDSNRDPMGDYAITPKGPYKSPLARLSISYCILGYIIVFFVFTVLSLLQCTRQ